MKRVPIALARKYGLYADEDYLSVLETEGEGTVDVPCWRHAVINFPHPLLQQGLVTALVSMIGGRAVASS